MVKNDIQLIRPEGWSVPVQRRSLSLGGAVDMLRQLLSKPVDLAFFQEHGWLRKLPQEAGALLTIGQFVQLLYNVETSFETGAVSYADLQRTLCNVMELLPVVRRFNTFSDVDYNHPHDRAIYQALAKGYAVPQSDGAFGAEKQITLTEAHGILRRFCNRRLAEEIVLPEIIKAICLDNTSLLARVIAEHVFKQAANALVDVQMPQDISDGIRSVLQAIREAKRPQWPVKDITGAKDNPNTWIFASSDGMFMREFHFASKKPNTEPVEIVQLNDTHYNFVNTRDEAEQNPSIMSTREFRLWLRGGSSVPNIRRTMEFARYADMTIVAGDVLDYLSWGCKQLVVENLFRQDVSMLACLGGHDITRVMQGKVGDPTSLDSRLQILADFWPHDIYYVSRVIKDKVKVIVMDNGLGRFRQSQIAPLQEDLDEARKNNHIVFLFMHEPICTRNSKEADWPPIRRNDPGNWDYASKCVGHPQADAATLAVYDLITQNADVVRGVFCGHMHSDYYTEIIASYKDAAGQTVATVIPQFVLTASVYERGHLCRIVVD